MTTRKQLRFAAALLAASCAGATDRGDLISLVQRVELVPGADALDVQDPTPVGTDLESIKFFLVEPLSQTSIDGFNPLLHLSLGGLPFDSASFNETFEGGIPPGALLAVKLAPPPGGIVPGSYDVQLKSPVGHRLVGVSGTVYDGPDPAYRLKIEIVAQNDVLPYIVRFRAGREVVEDIPYDDWSGEETVSLSGPVPPHGGVRVEFSERMRTPVPVEVTPALEVPTTFQTVGFGTKQTMIPVPLGVKFTSAPEVISWDDFFVDGLGINREVTVTTSDTVEGMEPAAEYRFVFDGTGAVTSSQVVVTDVSGEPLTLFFSVTLITQGDALYRNNSVTDTRTLVTAPVRIETPQHLGYLNRDFFAATGGVFAVSGIVTDPMDNVRVSVARDIDSPSGGIDATRTVVADVTALGTPVDRFDAALSIAASDPEGEYRIFAEAFDAGGASRGWDVTRVVKDTVPPALVGPPADVTILATDHQVPELCVTTARDTVRADLLFDGQPLDSTTVFTEVLLPSPPGLFRRFCFDPFPVLASFSAFNQLTVVLTDAAGNTSSSLVALKIRPVLLSVVANLAERGDIVDVFGFGLEGIDPQTDLVRLDGSRISLSRGIEIDGTGEAILRFVVPGSGPHDPDMLEMRVPHFASTGTLAFDVEGVTTTSVVLEVCQDRDVGPFVTNALTEEPLLTGEVVVGDLAVSGILVDASPIGGASDLRPGGSPIVLSFPTRDLEPSDIDSEADPGLDLWAWELLPSGWEPSTIRTVGAPEFLPKSVAAARGPNGDVNVAYVVRQGTFWQAEIASRVLTSGVISWTSQVVAFVPGGGSTPAPATALTFSEDGRGAVVFVAPKDGSPGALWAAVQRAPGPGFNHVLLDSAPGAAGSVSAVFDRTGTLWIAYGRDLGHFVPEGDEERLSPFEMRVLRIVRHPAGFSVQSFSSPSPRRALWPSIAIDPLSGLPALAYQEASFTTVLNLPPIEWPPKGALEYVVGKQRFAQWDGSQWQIDEVDDRPRKVLAFDEDHPLTSNLHLRSPRTTLRFTPDGTARIGYGSVDGGIFVASKAPGASSWTRDLVDVASELGPSLAFHTDAAGRWSFGYRDERLAHLRFVAENEDRDVIEQMTLDPPCTDRPYQRSQIFADYPFIIDEHDDFVLDIGANGAGSIFHLTDPAVQFDFFVTALEHDSNVSIGSFSATSPVARVAPVWTNSRSGPFVPRSSSLAVLRNALNWSTSISAAAGRRGSWFLSRTRSLPMLAIRQGPVSPAGFEQVVPTSKMQSFTAACELSQSAGSVAALSQQAAIESTAVAFSTVS